jgi:hypothetical protein
MAMAGAFLGPAGGVAAVAGTLVSGLVLGLAVLLARRIIDRPGSGRVLATAQRRPCQQRGQLSAQGCGARALRFPYATAIVAGTLGSLWWNRDFEPAVELVAMLWAR